MSSLHLGSPVDPPPFHIDDIMFVSGGKHVLRGLISA